MWKKNQISQLLLFWHLTKLSHGQVSPWWHCGMCAFTDGVLIVGCWSGSGCCFYSNYCTCSSLTALSNAVLPTNPWRKAWTRDAAPTQEKSLSNPSFSTWGSCTWRLQTTQSCRFPVCNTALAVNDIFSCLWAHMKTNNTSFLQTVKVEYYSCFSLCEILVYLWCIYIYYVLIWAYLCSWKEPLFFCSEL